MSNRDRDNSKASQNTSAKPERANDANSGASKQSGRVSFDSRGNAVWQWELETGKFGEDVSTQRLKTLESPELSIADTTIVRRPGAAASSKAATNAKPTPKPVAKPAPTLAVQDDARHKGGGFDPYNSGGRSAGKYADPFVRLAEGSPRPTAQEPRRIPLGSKPKK